MIRELALLEPRYPLHGIIVLVLGPSVKGGVILGHWAEQKCTNRA